MKTTQDSPCSPCLQIIRGLPGSGKSSLAKSFDCMHVELDMYCIRGRTYAWSPYRDCEARRLLKRRIADEMLERVDIVVSGVFPSMDGTLGHLVKCAYMFGYDVYIKTLDGDYGNIHNVRECDLKRMREKFEDNPTVMQGLLGMEGMVPGWVNRHVTFGLMPMTSMNIPYVEASPKDKGEPK